MIAERITRRRLITLVGAASGATLLSSCGWFGGSSSPTPVERQAVVGTNPTPEPKVVEKVVERVVTATPAVPDFNAAVKAAVEATVAAGRSGSPTPKVQEQPTTQKGRDIVQAMVDVQLKPGEKVVAEHPGFVQGDVLVSNPKRNGELTRMFDNNEESGLIVSFEKGTTIIAPYGADVVYVPGLDKKVLEQLLGQALIDMKEKGCEYVKTGKGCRWIYSAEPGMLPQSQVTSPPSGGVVGK